MVCHIKSTISHGTRVALERFEKQEPLQQFYCYISQLKWGLFKLNENIWELWSIKEVSVMNSTPIGDAGCAFMHSDPQTTWKSGCHPCFSCTVWNGGIMETTLHILDRILFMSLSILEETREQWSWWWNALFGLLLRMVQPSWTRAYTWIRGKIDSTDHSYSKCSSPNTYCSLQCGHQRTERLFHIMEGLS